VFIHKVHTIGMAVCGAFSANLRAIGAMVATVEQQCAVQTAALSQCCRLLRTMRHPSTAHSFSSHSAPGVLRDHTPVKG
jgi:hypothetical protein